MSQEIINRDVVIVGAGPAGMAASIHLSDCGIRHLVLDKSNFPRDKTCGDALSGKVVQFLNHVDTEWVKAVAHDSETFLGSFGVRFVAPNGKSLDIPFKTNLDTLESPPGFIASRFDFDAWLFSKANPDFAEVISGAEVTVLERHGNGVTIRYRSGDTSATVNTRIVIGADGDRSVVARQLAGRPAKKELSHYCAGLRRYYTGVTGFHERNFIELHFLPELLPGYLWIFPMSGGRANVGVGMLSSVISKKGIHLRKLMDDLIADHPALKGRFLHAVPLEETKGWGLPLGSKKRSISGDNYMLTGDAGSLIDPFTGEGIGNALVSGKIAAMTSAEALKKGEFGRSRLRAYDDAVYGQLWDELKLSRTLQRLTRFGWLFNFVVNKAFTNPLLQETITGMFEDVNLRNRLSRPSFYFKLLFSK